MLEEHLPMLRRLHESVLMQQLPWWVYSIYRGQCGRDTPDENIFKLIEVARTYGKY